MDGQAIISMFKRLVDDSSIDDDTALDLANTSKDEIEGDRGWRMLLAVDTSNVFTSANDYATEFDLPADFSLEDKVKLINSNDNNVCEIAPIDITDRILKKDFSNLYALDILNSKFYITGTVAEAQTIYLWYYKFTDDLTLSTSPVWPARFHKLIAYRMASIWLEGIDADQLTRLMWSTHEKIARKLESSMAKWDGRLAVKAMNNRTEFDVPQGALKTNQVDLYNNRDHY